MTKGHSMIYSFLGSIMIAVVSITIAGCSSAPKRVEADYGNSVNQMVQAATYNPEAAASTESIPVMGMDGKRALRSLDAMRTDTERVEDFDEVIDIELGGN